METFQNTISAKCNLEKNESIVITKKLFEEKAKKNEIVCEFDLFAYIQRRKVEDLEDEI